MKKISLFTLAIVLTFSIAGCKEGVEDTPYVDPCEGLEECFILDDSEVTERATFNNDTTVEMTNMELNQIYDFVSNYSFNYFAVNSSDVSRIKKLNTIWAYNTISDNLRHFSNVGKIDLYFDIQIELQDFRLEEMVNQNTLYLVDDDTEHFLYKSSDDTFVYTIQGTKVNVYEFNLNRNSFDGISYIKPSTVYTSEINEYDNVTFTENYISYSYDDIANEVVLETESLYMNDIGGYSMVLDNNGDFYMYRTFLDSNQDYGVMYRHYDITYDDETSMFELLYRNPDGNIETSYVVYDDFFKKVFNHPNLDSEVLAWIESAHPESLLIEILSN